MIIDKNREVVNEIHNACEWGAFNKAHEVLDRYVSRIHAESAEQERKEAAERAVKFVDQFDEDAQDGDFWTSADLQNVILNSSVKEGKTDSEKLSIAVKALEVIRDNALNPAHTMTKFGLEQVTDANRAISDRALKEIQG